MKIHHYIYGLCVYNNGPNLKYDIIIPGEIRYFSNTHIGASRRTLKNNHDVRYFKQQFIDIDVYDDVYYVEGIISLQIGMILASFPDLHKDYAKVKLVNVPNQPYLIDTMPLKYSKWISETLVFTYLYPTMFIFLLIVAEKDNAVRAYLKVKGFGLLEQNVAWLLILWFLTAFNSLWIVIIMTIDWSHNGALFSNSNLLTILVLFISYGFTNACFCVMVSGLCRTKRNAFVVITFFWIIMFIWHENDTSKDWTGTHIALINYFLYNCMFAQTIDNIFILETFSNGLQWYHLSYKNAANFEFKSFLCLIITGYLFFFLTFLFDQYNPGKYGVRFKIFQKLFRKKLFKIKPWKFMNRIVAKQRVETVQIGLTKDKVVRVDMRLSTYGGNFTVEVDDVSKRYQDVTIAESLNFKLYKNEITAMLGTNGCGKTVLCGMLSGLVVPDSGSILFNGHDVTTKSDKALWKLGLALGNETLIEDLTFEQNCIFHGFINGENNSNLNKVYETYSERMFLEKYYDTLTKDLPLPIQYQLSIICALCGDSEFVILDALDFEMEGFLQKYLIDLFSSLRANRTTFITTNSSYLAEELADRALVIQNGKLIGFGSPNYLKKTFGNFFILICIKNRDFNHLKYEKLIKIMQRFIPNLYPDNPITDTVRLKFIIDSDKTNEIREILNILEKRMDFFGFKCLMIRKSSLKDVLEVFGQQDDTQMKRDGALDPYQIIKNYIKYDNLSSSSIIEKYQLLKGKKFFNQTILVLLKKHLRAYLSPKYYILYQIFVPIIFCTYALCMGKTYNTHVKNVRRVLDLSPYEQPKVIISSQLVDRLYETNNLQPINTVWYYRQHLYEQKVQSIDIGSMKIGDYIFEAFDNNHHIKNIPMLILGMEFSFCFWPDDSDEQERANCFECFYNNFQLHSSATAYNVLMNAFIKACVDDSASITVAIDPLPMENGDSVLVFFNLHFLALCIALSVIFVFQLPYIRFFNEESKNTISNKHYHFWEGYEYFLSTIISLALKSLILVIVCLIYLHISDIFHIQDPVFGIFILTLLVSALYSTFYRIFLRLILRKIMLVEFVTILVTMIGILVYVFDDPGPFDWAFPNMWLSIFPLYIVGKLFLLLFQISYLNAYCAHDDIYQMSVYVLNCERPPNCCNKNNAWELMRIYILYILIMSIVLIQLVVIHQLILNQKYKLPWIKRKMKIMYQKQMMQVEFGEDMPKPNNKEILFQNVGLIRNGKEIIQKTSLSIKRGEIFGLLGPKGSGKRLLLRMINKIITPSYGNVNVFGYDMHESHKGISISHCSESTAVLIDNFKLGEHLEMHALSVGVPKEHVKKKSYQWCLEMDLQRDYRTKLKNCSRGTIKKLVFAMSLIGKPDIVLMDRMLQSIDEVTKLKMSNLLHLFTKYGGTVVMTMDSYINCEEFCDRLGIFVGGKLQAIDSFNNITINAADGYIVRSKLYPRILHGEHIVYRMKRVMSKLFQRYTALMEETFPGAIAREIRADFIYFFVPRRAASMQHIFDLLTTNTFSLNISEFSISSNTVSHIYDEYTSFAPDVPFRPTSTRE